jgi:hypothetical protein
MLQINSIFSWDISTILANIDTILAFYKKAAFQRKAAFNQQECMKKY